MIAPANSPSPRALRRRQPTARWPTRRRSASPRLPCSSASALRAFARRLATTAPRWAAARRPSTAPSSATSSTLSRASASSRGTRCHFPPAISLPLPCTSSHPLSPSPIISRHLPPSPAISHSLSRSPAVARHLAPSRTISHHLAPSHSISDHLPPSPRHLLPSHAIAHHHLPPSHSRTRRPPRPVIALGAGAELLAQPAQGRALLGAAAAAGGAHQR